MGVFFDENFSGTSIFFSGYDSLYFDRDMELSNEYSARFSRDDPISFKEQQVYNGATARLMNYNTHLEGLGTNIWERYVQKNSATGAAASTNSASSDNGSSNTNGADVQWKTLTQELNSDLANAKPSVKSPDLIKTIVERVQYNFEIKTGDSSARAETPLSDEEKILYPYKVIDDFGIPRWVDNQWRMHPVDLAKQFELKSVFERTLAEESSNATQEIVAKELSYDKNSTAASNNSQITINTDLLFRANGLRPGKLLKLDSNSGMPHPDDIEFDPSYVWKLVLGGKDGANMSDEIFLYYYKQAIKDVAMKDVIPGSITMTQKLFGAAAAVADVPLWSEHPVSKAVKGLNYAIQFPGEILKNLSTHYNDFNYTWEQAVTDAFKTTGIETIADMSADSLGKYIAKRYNMDKYSQWLLTKGLNTVFEEYGKKAVKIF